MFFGVRRRVFIISARGAIRASTLIQMLVPGARLAVLTRRSAKRWVVETNVTNTRIRARCAGRHRGPIFTTGEALARRHKRVEEALRAL